MEIELFYESTAIAQEFEFSAKLVTVPANSFADPHIVQHPEELIHQLGLEVLDATFLSESTPEERVEHVRGLLVDVITEAYGPSNRAAEFAEQLVEGEYVIAERSPAGSDTLQRIVMTSGVGAGAYVGVVAAGGTPFVLITVPLGMILCGAASGAAMGLEERIYRLIRGRRE